MKKALVVGINAYPGYPLHGCVNDAMAYVGLLQAKGFTNISVLLDGSATRAAILTGLNWLTSGFSGVDGIALCRSGHGSRVPDTSGDEADRYDECFVSVDMRAVLDDEIRAYLGRVPDGITIDVIDDCCYAGTGTRAPLAKSHIQIGAAKFVPASVVKVPKNSKALFIVPGLNHSLMAACGELQTSREISVNGIPHGAFSYFIVPAIQAGGSRTANVATAAAQLAGLGLSQIPQLEATQAEANQPAFT
jgi:metacaspase-1